MQQCRRGTQGAAFPDHNWLRTRATQFAQHPLRFEAWQSCKRIKKRLRASRIHRNKQGCRPRLIKPPMRRLGRCIKTQPFQFTQGDHTARQRAKIADLPFVDLHCAHAATIAPRTTDDHITRDGGHARGVGRGPGQEDSKAGATAGAAATAISDARIRNPVSFIEGPPLNPCPSVAPVNYRACRAARPPFYFVYSSIQSSTVVHHNSALSGLVTQWPSSGK